MSKLHAEYRQLENPKQLNRFLDGGGALANRGETADCFDYEWQARKLKFEPHFRSHVLLHITKYNSARDLHWATRKDSHVVFNSADHTEQVASALTLDQQIQGWPEQHTAHRRLGRAA